MKTHVHRPYQKGETIAAIATPPGEGGVAIVRISGENALLIADKIFSKPVCEMPSHTAHFGKILNEKKEVVDKGLLLVMRGPKSYTGEDTVEIHCHGGSLITKKVLETALKAGARAANPGEFTFKAFMNGKIDLAQAEAVQQLISAKSELALQMAEKQLEGALSKHIKLFQKELVDIAAILEAWVDFPEEGLEFASQEEILLALRTTLDKMQILSASFHEGKVLNEGISLCLIGSPNVGKSSLMNALLGKERAIVTDIPGTTRDLLEEEMRLKDLHIKLLDTAGIRETDEIIEKEGIRRSKKALDDADLVLLVLDASRKLEEEDKELFAHVPKDRTLVIWNKIDLRTTQLDATEFSTAFVSAKSGEGLDDLKNSIYDLIWKKGPPNKEEVVLTNMRHKRALDEAIVACKDLIRGLEEGVSPEFLSSDMRKMLNELGTIIGTDITEDILNAIFSKFCVGK